jgi:hypothetical protein
MKSFYEDAIPLGPILEIKSTAAEDSSFTPEMASEFLQRWQDKSALLLNDPEALNSSETLKNYSHDVVSSGNLLAAREYTNEAEEAYRLSAKVWPENPEAVAGLVKLLAATGRSHESTQILEDFLTKFPSQQPALSKLGVGTSAAASPEHNPFLINR